MSLKLDQTAATAAALRARGSDVYVFDLPSSIEAADRLEGVRYVPVDVTSPDQVRAGAEEAASGEAPLRTVVNCAGIGPSARILGRSGVHDLALYAKVIEVNLVAPSTSWLWRRRASRRPTRTRTASVV